MLQKEYWPSNKKINMKKIMLLFSIMLLLYNSTKACDICGCGVGNNYVGILPEFSKKIIGIRYRYNSITNNLGINGMYNYFTTQEKYYTVEVWAAMNITKKFRLMVSIPYNLNVKENASIQKKQQGVGDFSTQAFYQIFNKQKSVFQNKLLIQSLWVGVGVKLATGRYSNEINDASQNTNLYQLGSGSTDFLVSAMYDIRLQDAGVNVTGLYKINTKNEYDYTYGNKLNLNLQVYHKFKLNSTSTIAPNFGFQYEQAAKDINKKIINDASGGNIALGTFGFETIFNKISVGSNWQIPLQQSLAMGIAKANQRFMVHVSFLL